MNLEQIARVAELMSQHELTEFVLEDQEMKLVIKRGGDRVAMVGSAPPPPAAPLPVSAAPRAGASQPARASAGGDADGSGRTPGTVTVDAPIVGTLYVAPSPGAPPFVKVGDPVDVDTVVCVVEAMKVMNEVKAEVQGVVERILVENGTPVEFGQPLFEIRPGA
jgi:acetyl-CoA carboxylase biotin carboxyl carrier protein